MVMMILYVSHSFSKEISLIFSFKKKDRAGIKYTKYFEPSVPMQIFVYLCIGFVFIAVSIYLFSLLFLLIFDFTKRYVQ